MKSKTFQNFISRILSGIFFGTLISYGALGSLATAFSLQLPAVGNNFYQPIDLQQLLLYCLLFSTVFSLCFTIKRLWFLVPVVILGILGYHWHFKGLQELTYDFLYIISKQYDNAYQCGVLLFNDSRPTYAEIYIVFRWFAFLGTSIVTWTTCKRQSSYWVLLFSLLTFVPCCVVTNTVPESSLFFLWLFSIFLFMLTNHIRRSHASNYMQWTLVYAIPLFVALVLLFTFVPRDTYSGQDRADALLDRFHDMFSSSNTAPLSGGTATEDIVDLTALKDRKERNIPVMYIAVPERGTYYLRGEIYSYYDGTQWLTDKYLDELPWLMGITTDKSIKIRTRFLHDMLYVPYCIDPNILSEGEPILPNNDKLKEYAYTLYKEGTSLTEPINYTVMTSYTDIPIDTQQWANSFLAERLFTTQEPSHFISNEQTISLITDLVGTSATYDLSPESMDPSYTDFVQWFMEQGDEGYCVHFATSAAVLLRASGIPARYVTGYTVEAIANRENTVYQKNAHAWVEYWTIDKGWQILDVTPSNDQEASKTTTSSENAILPSTTVPTEPPSEATKPTTSPTEKTPTPPSYDPTIGGTRSNPLLRKIVKVLLYLGVAIGIFLSQRKLRLALWNRKLNTASKKNAALLLWNRSLRFSKLLNKTPDPKLRHIAERAKFSRHEITAVDLEPFDRFFRKARAELSKGSFLRKFYSRWILALF